MPRDLPVRPTTDFAKEGLFNILANRIDFEGIEVLDLFSGTGHISLEFSSRGASRVLSVDKHFKCVSFLRDTAAQLGLGVTTVKEDVFRFLAACHDKFDLIFADPPYDLPNIPDIHKHVFENGMLKENGMLIIEHGPGTDLSTLEGFTNSRRYGNVNFSFFEG